MKWHNQDDLPNKYFVGGEGYNIDPKNKEKRLRVLGGWLLEAVMEDINPFNHVNRIRAYMKQGATLLSKYPEEVEHLDKININMWAQYQQKYKTELKPMIKLLKRRQINEDLKRMGF